MNVCWIFALGVLVTVTLSNEQTHELVIHRSLESSSLRASKAPAGLGPIDRSIDRRAVHQAFEPMIVRFSLPVVENR